MLALSHHKTPMLHLTSQALPQDNPSTYYTPTSRPGGNNRADFNPSENIDHHHHSNRQGQDREPWVDATGGSQQHHPVQVPLNDATDIFKHPTLQYIEGTVGSESIAMFGSFGLSAVWCFTVWKSHLALQRESKVLLLGFIMEFSSYDLNQWLWRYALFKMEIPLQCFPSF